MTPALGRQRPGESVSSRPAWAAKRGSSPPTLGVARPARLTRVPASGPADPSLPTGAPGCFPATLAPSRNRVPRCPPGRAGGVTSLPLLAGKSSPLSRSRASRCSRNAPLRRAAPIWGHSASRTPRPSPRAAHTCPYPRTATARLHSSPTSSSAPQHGNNKVSLVEVASAGSGEGTAREEEPPLLETRVWRGRRRSFKAHALR